MIWRTLFSKIWHCASLLSRETSKGVPKESAQLFESKHTQIDFEAESEIINNKWPFHFFTSHCFTVSILKSCCNFTNFTNFSFQMANGKRLIYSLWGVSFSRNLSECELLIGWIRSANSQSARSGALNLEFALISDKFLLNVFGLWGRFKGWQLQIRSLRSRQDLYNQYETQIGLQNLPFPLF